jgi:hypothetical protein
MLGVTKQSEDHIILPPGGPRPKRQPLHRGSSSGTLLFAPLCCDRGLLCLVVRLSRGLDKVSIQPSLVLALLYLFLSNAYLCKGSNCISVSLKREKDGTVLSFPASML